MRVIVVSALVLTVCTISLNHARKFQFGKETNKAMGQGYGNSPSHVEPSIESYGVEYQENSEDGYYPPKTPNLSLTYFISQFLFGSFFMGSALLCALQATCPSHPTVTLTSSFTTTTTTPLTTTKSTSTTTSSTTTTPITKSFTTTSTTRTTTPITRTSAKSITVTATTTSFPVATSVTRSTTTTFTSTTFSRTISTKSTTTTTTTTTKNGRRRRSIALNDNFWIDGMNAAEFLNNDEPIDPSVVASISQPFTAMDVGWHPEGAVDSSLLHPDEDAE